MKHTWVIEPTNIERVKAFLDLHRDDLFVRERIRWNLRDDKPPVGKVDFWQQMVACLLTTQQRSGPTSAVTRFTRMQPFPLAYDTCLGQPDVERFAKEILTGFGGLRRTSILAGEVAKNLALLEGGWWQPTLDTLDQLRPGQGVEAERVAADFIDNTFWGFGPKQALLGFSAAAIGKVCAGGAALVDSAVVEHLIRSLSPEA
jgi:hypothetical protein